MNKGLFQDQPKEQREQMLRDNCYKVVENHTYTRPLSKEEVANSKDELFEVSLKTLERERELKAISKKKKAEIKVIKAEQVELVQHLQFQQSTHSGTVYLLDDQDAGMMEIYDSFGRFVSIRPLNDDERQRSILTIKKKGTND